VVDFEAVEAAARLVGQVWVIACVAVFWRDIAIKVGPNKDAIVS
jgi:hypothetical protein